MADADALIESLRSGGEARGSGAFTLDPIKAREKLREFQLADPHRYVLLLVQAMVLRGATRVEVEIDTDDLRMTSDARPFGLDELTDLYALLFADDAPRPGLRELALALNAAMATDPRSLRLECSGPEGGEGVRLEQRNDESDKVEPATGLGPGVRVHVREKFRLGLVRRFFAVGSDVVREQVLLRQHCGFAAIEVVLGGKTLVGRKAATDVASWHRIVLGDRNIGEVGFSPVGDKGRIELVRHHVWLCTHVLDDPQLAGLRGIVDVSHLRTDASLSDVVRDELYDAVIEAVGAARDMALAAASRSHRNGDGIFAGPLREVLCRRIGDHLERADKNLAAEPLRDFLAVALWHTIGGHQRTSAALLEAPQIRYASVDAKPAPTDVADFVYAKGHAAGLLLATFGARAIDCSAEVSRAVLRENNRRAFAERLHAVVLPEGRTYDRTYAHVTKLEVADVRGVIGWAPNGGPSWIRIVLDNCLLIELPFAPELSTIHVVVTAPFTPSALFDDVMRDQAFTDAMHASIAAFGRMVREICESLAGRPEIPSVVADDLLRYVAAILSGDHATTWLESVGLVADDIEALYVRLGHPWRRDVGVDGDGKLAHPIAKLAVFEDAAGQPIDLARIALALREEGMLRVISLGRPRLQHPPQFVTRVGEKRLALLEALFGQNKIRRVGHDYEKWLARESFAARIVAQPMHLDSACAVGPIEFVHMNHPGLVGIAEHLDDSAGQQATVQVFVESRPIATLRLGPTIRGLMAAVAVADEFLNHKCDGLDATGNAAAERMFAAGYGNLLDHLLEAGTTLTPRLRLVALDSIRLACPAPAYMQAWIALVDEHGVTKSTPLYLELLALGDTRDPGSLHNTVQSHVTRELTAHPDKIRDALRGQPKKTSTWSVIRSIAAARLQRLLDLPTLPIGTGNPVGVETVIDALDDTTTFGYLPAELDAPAEFADVVRLDEPTRMMLAEIFGASRLRSRAPEVALAEQRLAFEQREQLADLALPPESTLASIVVEIDGVRGMIGVPNRLPNAAPGKVAITHLRRTITEVDPIPGTGWLGILDGDGFGVERDFEGLTERELERVTEIIELHRPMVIGALCAGTLTGADGEIRRAWVQHLLRQVLPLVGRSQSSLERAGVSEVVDAPLFVDAEGTPRSLEDLRSELHRHGSLAVVRKAGLRTDRLLVLIRDDVEDGLLRHLFAEIEDAEPLAARRAAFEKTREDAAPLPARPADAFAFDEIASRGLSGAVWLSAGVDETSTITLGVDGRALTPWRGSRMFPCAGAITGEGVLIAEDYTECTLSRSREDYLKSRAALLYVRLAAAMRDTITTVDDPRARLLRELLVRLHDIQLSGRKWPSHEMRRLYRDLQDVALLPLASGRAISLRAALQTRPAELAALFDAARRPRETVVDNRSPTPEPPPVAPVVVERAPTPIVEEPVRVATPSRPFPPPAPVVAPPPTQPAPTVETMAPPPPPAPEQILRERILSELRLLHRRDMSLLTESHLDEIRVDALNGNRIATRAGPRVIVDSAHAIVRRALVPDADPLLVSVIASSALTALNVSSADVTDADEARLLRLHAEHLLTAGA